MTDSAQRQRSTTINAFVVKQGQVVGLDQMRLGQTTRRIDTAHLQGEGSFVLVSSATQEEVDLATAFTKEHQSGDNWLRLVDDFNARFLAEHILDWNWRDEQGQPLSLPKDDLSVFSGLTIEEYEFLYGLF